MNLNKHYALVGKHAFLSASKYHWINYDEEKLDLTFLNHTATIRGTELHALAFDLIRLGVKLPRNTKTLNMYVNDALGFRMGPEQILYFSDNCYGTADALGFKKNLLRIYDLKTGSGPTSEKQLWVYAALFCLEYDFKPMELEFDLRIYQNDEIREFDTDPDVITHVMDRIKTFDKRIDILKMEASNR